MTKQQLAYELHALGWSYRILGKYFGVSGQSIFNWVQGFMKYLDNPNSK